MAWGSLAEVPVDAESSRDDLLDELDSLHMVERETQTRVLLVATDVALDAAPVDPETARLPGRQQMKRLGGEGTPKVAEFAPALVGGRLQLSTWSADRLVTDGLDLRFRLPRLYARLTALEVAVGHARHVARATRHLSAAQAAGVDARVAESADGRLPWGRFSTLVEAAVLAADPEAAEQAERQAATSTFAKPTRSSEHGMRGFYVRADLGVIARLDAAVQFFAEALKDLGAPGNEDERRVHALLLLTDPAKAIAALKTRRDRAAGRPAAQHWPVLEDLMPRVQLHVHLAQTEDGVGPVARVEDHPPISSTWVKEHLGPRCRFTVRPVLDPLAQTPVDAWEVPVAHRRAVKVITPADVFPFAAAVLGSGGQVDHTIPYDRHGPPGQSRVGNYGPMTTRHHRLKTHGGWRCAQPFPGIYVWQDPSGATYLVDHSGTRRLDVIRTPHVTLAA